MKDTRIDITLNNDDLSFLKDLAMVDNRSVSSALELIVDMIIKDNENKIEDMK